MTIYRGLHKSQTFPEKADKLEVANSASCKLLQVTDDATFYAPISMGSNLAITGMVTVTGTFVASATTDLNSCLLGAVRTSTSAMETTAYNDFIILMKPGNVLATLTLSTEYITDGRILIVKDISGFSATASTQIRIVPETGGTLDGGTTAATIQTGFGSLMILSDSASYWTALRT